MQAPQRLQMLALVIVSCLFQLAVSHCPNTEALEHMVVSSFQPLMLAAWHRSQSFSHLLRRVNLKRPAK